MVASWDDQRSAEMAARGSAIHEETVLPDLMVRLRFDASGKADTERRTLMR